MHAPIDLSGCGVCFDTSPLSCKYLYNLFIYYLLFLFIATNELIFDYVRNIEYNNNNGTGPDSDNTDNESFAFDENFEFSDCPYDNVSIECHYSRLLL